MNIENKIENLIKRSIVDLGLVSTGKMLNSIKVTKTSTGYSVSAVDYFTYKDQEFNIVENVMKSAELKTFIEESFKKEIEDSINNL